MASDTADEAATPAASESPSFTLQIVSPSVGVPQPLAFQSLSPTTTVQQVKERIRGSIDSKPTDQAQRLIHRGRLLARVDETLLDVFGDEALRSSDPQTLHLVLRDLSDGRAAFTPTPPPMQAPNANAIQQPNIIHTQAQAYSHPQQVPHYQHHPQYQYQYQQYQPQYQAQPQVQVGPAQFQQQFASNGMGPQVVVNSTGQPMNPMLHVNPHQIAQQAMNAAQLMLANQIQRNRTPAQGPQDAPQGMASPNAPGTTGMGTPGRTASPLQPDGTRTVVREMVAPNGQQWRITVNESITGSFQRVGRMSSPFPNPDASGTWSNQPRSVPNGGALSNGDVQSIIRAADTNSATRVMTDAMRRNASSSSVANLANAHSQQPIAPGVTTPLVPSRNGSATGTPDPYRAAGRPRNAPSAPQQTQSSTGAPEVYILSSPNGPRALLLNSSAEMYYNPPLRAVLPPMGLPHPPRPLAFGNSLTLPYLGPPQATQPQASSTGSPPALHQGANNVAQPQLQQGHPQQGYPQQALPRPPHAQPQIGHAIVRPDGAQAQAVRIAHIWPHVWMLIRLALFIWWFTSPTASWSRWFTVLAIAVTLFLVNAGLLNGAAEQFWVPVRRHLENMIPLADRRREGDAPDLPGRHDGGARDARGAGGRGNPDLRRDLDPADTAARLVQQRRLENTNWLMNQVRRLERAGLLFLASIAPGVAERHIAHLEAEARAELQRQRQEEAAAAATATAEATPAEDAGTSEGADQSNGHAESVNSDGRATSSRQEGDGADRTADPPAAEEPLIAL